MARFNGSAGSVHVWAREPSRDAGTLGKAGVPQGPDPPARRLAPRLPPKRASARSATPHHRSASPFPVPSIPLRAGHPSDPLLTQGPAWGPPAPPRWNRNMPSGIFRRPSEQMPRPLGTYGHGPSCSLPSVVNRWCNEDDGAHSVLLMLYSHNTARSRVAGIMAARSAGSCLKVYAQVAGFYIGEMLNSG